jgi:hypothetical protein
MVDALRRGISEPSQSDDLRTREFANSNEER